MIGSQGWRQREVTSAEIVSRPEFQVGIKDGYESAPFNPLHEESPTWIQETYERGRQVGVLMRVHGLERLGAEKVLNLAGSNQWIR